VKHTPIRSSTNNGSIPAGTDMRVSAEKYDADTEKLAAEFTRNVDPRLQRNADATFRKMAAMFRPVFVRRDA